MNDLAVAGRALLLDLASTLSFFLLYAVTKNLVLSLAAAVALAGTQIGWTLVRGKRVDAVQWISLAVVFSSAGATLWSGNTLYIRLQPSLLYLLVGIAMLQRDWMAQYMPPRAFQFVPDLVTRFGYIWAGLMFFSAALNLLLAFSLTLVQWGVAMSAWATASKIVLFFLQFAVMKTIGRRRARGSRALAA